MNQALANDELRTRLEQVALALLGQDAAEAALDGAGAAARMGELARQAQSEGWRGVPEMLRLVTAGLNAATYRAGDAELVDVGLWLGEVLGYLGGEMPPERHGVLLDQLAAMAWMPQVAPRMRGFLLERLDQGSRYQAPEPAADDTLALDQVDSSAFEPVDSSAVVVESDTAFALDDSNAADDWGASALVPGGANAADAPAGTADDSPIWISPEELQLSADAVAIQLMPLAEQLSAGCEPEQQATLVEEYAYQAGLVLTALELLGLTRLNVATDTVRAEIALLAQTPPEGVQARMDLIVQWQVALMGFLYAPAHSENSALLVETLTDPLWAQALGPEQVPSLMGEFARIRIGVDPKLIAARKRVAEPADVTLSVAEDVAASVIEGMLRELPNNAAELCERLRALGQVRDVEHLAAARRVAHTLKGDANTVGVRGIATLTHALEDILGELAKRTDDIRPSEAQLMEEAADCVEAMADHVLGRGPAPDDTQAVLQRVLDWSNALLEGNQGIAAAVAAPVSETSSTFGADTPPSVAVASATEDAPATRRESARATLLQVPAQIIEGLLRLSSETMVLARQVEAQLAAVTTAQRDMQAQSTIARDLVAQLDDLVALRGAALQSARLTSGREVDPLEMDQYSELHIVSRRLIENSGDTTAHLHALDGALVALNELSAQQDRIHGELQQSVIGMRTVPLADQIPRYQRVVRQTARTLDKRVELEVIGEQTRIDSDILERVTEPLVHALRNAVDHGIESPAERERAGKPVVGRLRLSAVRRGDDIVIELSDDGRGLDYVAIRASAVARGLLAPTQNASEEDLARLIALPGFSTREHATEVSGRGIGMDVVARRVRELRGTLGIRSRTGQGMVLTLVLPASHISAHVAVARGRQRSAAVVVSSVTQFVPVLREDVLVGVDGMYCTVGDERIVATTLDAALDATVLAVPPERGAVGLLVEDDQGQRQIVLAESVDEMRSMIVKSFGPYVAAIPAVRGATILGDGGVAPVVDLAQLVGERLRTGHSLTTAAETPATHAPRVVVVDDSLSVRRALEQLMQDAGYDVLTARDGLEALDLVMREPPVALLVDLEMPRMNGLELTRYLRSQPATRALPVVMVTSRTSDRHRQMIAEAGVDELVGKPYVDDELVRLVQRLVKDRNAGGISGTVATVQ
jgi:chemosensory pili system protein ChpA (sensor histidine kinase/response regulator)